MAAPRVWSSRRALVFAALALIVVKQVVPFGHLLLYPFTLLSTWVHEMGHGIAALCVGGHFDQLAIFRDASGLAFTREAACWPAGVVAAAGFVAPPLAGAAVLGMARGPRRAGVALWVLALALAVSLVVWVRSLAGLIVIPLVCAVIVYGALRFSGNRRMWLAQFLGIYFGLDTISRIDYLFTRTVMIDGEARASDVSLVAGAWGGVYFVWGLLLAAVSLGLVAFGLWMAWRVPAARNQLPGRAYRSTKP